MSREKLEGAAADRIKDAFMEIYGRKPLHEISVKEICAQAGIARTTFYNYFFDIYDLMGRIEDDLIRDLRELNREFPAEDFHSIRPEELHYFDSTLDYVWERRDWIRSLLDRGRDSQFAYKWKQIMKEDFRRKFRAEGIQLRSEELTLEMIASAAIGIYSYWVSSPERIPKETISQEVLYRYVRTFIY